MRGGGRGIFGEGSSVSKLVDVLKDIYIVIVVWLDICYFFGCLVSNIFILFLGSFFLCVDYLFFIVEIEGGYVFFF